MVPQAIQNPEMQHCIEACAQCHDICLQMAMTHCLREGGKHVEEQHFRLMINCAQICRTSADFMLSESALHGAICAACAQVCNACAESCERIGSDMERCAQACRRCAESCEDMAQHPYPGMARSHPDNAALRTNA